MEITLVQIMGVLVATLVFTLLLGWVLFRKLQSVQFELQSNLQDINQALEVQCQTVNEASEKTKKTLSSEFTLVAESISLAINQSVQQTTGELNEFREAVSRQFDQAKDVQHDLMHATEQSLKDSIESHAFAALVEIKNLAEHIGVQIEQSYTELDRSQTQYSQDVKNHLDQLLSELNKVFRHEVQKGKDGLAEKLHSEITAMSEVVSSVTSEANQTVLEKIVGNSEEIKQGSKEITFGLSRLKNEIVTSNNQSMSGLKESANALKDNLENVNTAISGVSMSLARQNRQAQIGHNEIKESLDAVKSGVSQAVQAAVADEIESLNTQQEQRYSTLHLLLEKTNNVVKDTIEAAEQELKSSVSQTSSEQIIRLKSSLEALDDSLRQNATQSVSEMTKNINNVFGELSANVVRNKQELLESHREDATWQKRAISIVRKEIETAHTVYNNFTSRFDSLERDVQKSAVIHDDTNEKLARICEKLDSTYKNWVEALPESQAEAYQQITKELERTAAELKNLIQKASTESTQTLHGAINELSRPTIEYTKYQASISNITNSLQSLAANEDLVVSVDGIIQHFGGLRLEKLEDESHNLVTDFFYKEGKRVSSDTMSDGRLKYRMLFENDKPSRGFEFDRDGNTIHEYEYDPAGEVLSRTDFLPDGSIKNVVNY